MAYQKTDVIGFVKTPILDFFTNNFKIRLQMEYINKLSQDLEKINTLITSPNTTLSKEQIEHFKESMNSLSINIGEHIIEVEKVEEKYQSDNKSTLEARNQAHQQKIVYEEEKRALNSRLANADGVRTELNRQIQKQQMEIESYRHQLNSLRQAKRDVKEKLSWLKYTGIIGSFTDEIVDLASKISGMEATINSLNDSLNYNLQEKSKNRAERSELEATIRKMTIDIDKKETEIDNIEHKLIEFASKLKAIADELVFTKKLVHGLKEAIVEIEAAKGKANVADILYQAFTRSRFSNLKLQDKAINSLKDAIEFLKEALKHMQQPKRLRSIAPPTGHYNVASILIGRY